MDIWVILGTAIGLAMDAFAVAIASSVTIGKVSPRQIFRLSFHFGLFQFLMPVIGWLAGRSVEAMISNWDHWIAFLLLGFIGAKSVAAALSDEGCGESNGDPTKGISLVSLSIATSIDALAVGLSLGVLRVTIWLPSVIIGIVAGGLTLVGMLIGSRLGARFGRKMEIMGGIVLIIIGLSILVRHLAES